MEQKIDFEPLVHPIMVVVFLVVAALFAGLIIAMSLPEKPAPEAPAPMAESHVRYSVTYFGVHDEEYTTYADISVETPLAEFPQAVEGAIYELHRVSRLALETSTPKKVITVTFYVEPPDPLCVKGAP